MSHNPYAAPASIDGTAGMTDSGRDELVGRSIRFVAAMVDGLLVCAILIPIGIATGYNDRDEADQFRFLEEIAMLMLGEIVWLGLNGYLLGTRGQTVGKMLTKIRIVDARTGSLLPFVRVYVYRSLWLIPIVLLALLIPGMIGDLLIGLAWLGDKMSIFGKERRCLHDFIAGSKVVGFIQPPPIPA